MQQKFNVIKGRSVEGGPANPARVKDDRVKDDAGISIGRKMTPDVIAVNSEN